MITGHWRANRTERVFTVFKWVGVLCAIMALTGAGPSALHTPDMLPFLFDKLVISVGLIVPIGAVFLALLINYGLLEGVGVLCQPLMRPLWRTPGRSAIDAVASFVGSYSIGLLITNRVYQSGQYSAREAAIIATGFSTVSATFMIIVAKTLNLMSMWNLYFWLTLLITFTVTAITVRLPPLSRMDDETTHQEAPVANGQRLTRAWQESLTAAESAPGLLRSVAINFKEGMLMQCHQLKPPALAGARNPGAWTRGAAVPSLVLLPSSAHVRPRRQLNGCRFASAGGISRFPGERVPAAVWLAFLRCSSGAACS